MKLTFIGANHEVTGSCHYLEVGDTKLLVDCGMEQGGNIYKNVDLPVSCSDIDYVLLTHAHIDHAGNLPLIYAHGFRGKVITTAATGDLCCIMLKDSAHIQEMDAEWKNRKARRAGRPESPPLYTLQDAARLLEHLEVYEYDEIVTLSDSVTIRFIDAGHLLGSASIEVWCKEGDVAKKIVFSGDIGNKNKPLIRDPEYIEEADYVVMECTYGDRCHTRTKEHVSDLAKVIEETLGRGGNVVLPAFAVGRTQELLYFLRKIKQDHMVNGCEDFEVYVDSPLAVEATHVFKEHLLRCYDTETKALVEQNINPINFPGLKLSVTSEESKEINFNSRPKVIISASGMCDAGRIRHHLKHNLWRPECSVVFAGYQASGTLGRILLEGSETVRLFGESIDVEAHIEVLEGLSGHADRNGLLEWISAYKEKPKMVFAVHGADVTCERFVEHLQRELGLSAAAPFSGSVYDLAEGRWMKQTEGVLAGRGSEGTKKANSVFARLLAAGDLLHHVIIQCEGRTNKDLGKFADQIHALCDKWNR